MPKMFFCNGTVGKRGVCKVVLWLALAKGRILICVLDDKFLLTAPRLIFWVIRINKVYNLFFEPMQVQNLFVLFVVCCLCSVLSDWAFSQMSFSKGIYPWQFYL